MDEKIGSLIGVALGLAFWPVMIWYYGIETVVTHIIACVVFVIPVLALAAFGQFLTSGR